LAAASSTARHWVSAFLLNLTRQNFQMYNLALGLLSMKFMKEFDYKLDFPSLDFRAHPELYRIGRGEQGVLLVEPYKSEILPHWRFKTPALAQRSAEKIYRLFLRYKKQGDFVGMDMARKFLQMGYTRARRYANYPGGRKYAANGKDVLPRQNDPVKAEAAEIFREKWRLARNDEEYLQKKNEHRARYEHS
jgi:hypothetical protein